MARILKKFSLRHREVQFFLINSYFFNYWSWVNFWSITNIPATQNMGCKNFLCHDYVNETEINLGLQVRVRVEY